MNPERRHVLVRELFARAMALSVDTRAAFLQQACGDDLTLRAEVEGLLAEHDSDPAEGVATVTETRPCICPSQRAPAADEPAASGKSSLFKAGLLPRLGRHVRPVYVEASPTRTEADLLRGLLRECPELSPDSGLLNALTAMRRGRLLPSGQKVLLVLDQFEQWLANRPDSENAALVAAVRQCDGARLQAVFLVRDDFWMAITRFMAALEVRLVEGENAAAVDLFNTTHAHSVLKNFGRSYGALPKSDVALTREQNLFLDQAVAELAQDWKVIPVRLVLFAEMIKARHSGAMAPRLRDSLRAAPAEDGTTLPTASALADYLPDDDVLWSEVGARVARALVRSDFVSLKRWLDALRPVRGHLKAPLAALYRDDPRSERASRIVDILSDYASDDAGLAADLLLDAEPAHFGPLLDITHRNAPQAAAIWKAELARVLPDAPADRAEPAPDLRAARRARAALALLRVGADGEAVWRYLRHSPDSRVRGFILDLLRPMGIGRGVVADRLRAGPPGPSRGGKKPGDVLFDPVVSTRRALILALGAYDLPADGEGPLLAALLDRYANDPDAGVHAAAEWTLRRWHQEAALAAADARLRDADRDGRRWYISPQGLILSVIESPGEFLMGTPPGKPWLRVHETAHRRVIRRRYAIAAKEVSLAQFEAFLKEDNDPERRRRFAGEPPGEAPSCPRNNLSWYDAVAFCNWLSVKERLTPCYLPNQAGLYGPGMSIKPNALELSGYRVPTEAEWEYAARAGAATCRCYGNADQLLARYAWTAVSSSNRTHPCGMLLPNDFGLFDTLGNLIEWTQNVAENYPSADAGPIPDVLDPAAAIDKTKPRVLRGGSFLSHEDDVRVMRRDRTEPSEWHTTYGLRPVRTIP